MEGRGKFSEIPNLEASTELLRNGQRIDDDGRPVAPLTIID